MAQPDRLEGAPDAAVGVDGVERQLQPAAVSQRVAASKAAAEKRTAKAMSADERAIKRRADQRLRRAKASDRGEQRGRATAVEGKQHSPAEAEETVESAVEHLGLPPLTAVRPDARASAAVMAVTLLPPLSLPPPPQPPAQRTAAESAAAERAAAEEAKERAAAERAAKKARRAERERRICEEGERALWHEAARATTTWRRVHDPSDDEGGPPCPEACEPLFEALIEAQDKVGDEAGDEVGEEAEDHDEDHDETNRSLNRFGASRSANSSAAHSIAASPFHAIPSRSIRSIWDGRMWHERTAHEIWDGRMSGRRMRWAHDPNTGPFLLEVSPTDPSIWDGRNGWDGRARY